MSGRERDSRRPAPSAAVAADRARTNEYFVPKDGIDREVITADICRYLGNDALVRPGSYEDPQTRVLTQGYYLTAYRNLTSAMITDLKQDSARWADELQATSSRGQISNGIPVRDSNGMVRSNKPVVEYRASTTHQSRQYYGPTENTPAPPASYPTSSTPGGGNPVYGDAIYGSGTAYGQPSQPAYGSQGYAPENYVPAPQAPYIQGSNYRSEQESQHRTPLSGGQGAIPRQGFQPTSNYDGRSQPNYQSSAPYQSNIPAPSQYSSTGEPYGGYSRTPYDTPMQDEYDTPHRGGYPSTTQYSQPSSTTATANQGARRGDRDREERDRHSSHRSGRR
ncbi:hypothetical protein BJ875DRAFT_377206 [Amylocarpus encephaloides]|uniref:Transcription factor RfeG n=1 Tax=Amylocarpus encephaloides TaxID=45428 RepID=A0A9P7YJH1_9HELO|nr:hypothetical protein BJ875DRAFT_377206 [Amylocarpus encephaloides]